MMPKIACQIAVVCQLQCLCSTSSVRTSCGYVLAREISSLVAAEKSGGLNGRGGTFGELLVELGYSGHADGIFGGTETLYDCQAKVQDARRAAWGSYRDGGAADSCEISGVDLLKGWRPRRMR